MSNLRERLNEISKSVAMHMPGHKRNPHFFEGINILHDFTEIPGLDNLHNPSDILLELNTRVSNVFGSHKSNILTNGSTGGIISAIRALTARGDKILISRSSHKSVYHAVELCNLNCAYFSTNVDAHTGIGLELTAQILLKALEEHTDTKVVVVTSPTYEGILSPVSELCDICHKRNIKVILDCAHGAHMGFTDYFKADFMCCDVVVQSLHKTLPSLTQTSVLHVNSADIDTDEISRQIDIFETSSPSYVLMQSVENCLDYIEARQFFYDWQDLLETFYSDCKMLKNLSIFTYDNKDNSKIVIDSSKTNITGYKLETILRETYSIYLEMASECYALAMTGAGDTKHNLQSLVKALYEIDKKLTKVQPNLFIAKQVIPIKEMPSYKALATKNKIRVPLNEALGKVCLEYLWVYPPGVPYIVPGEIIDENVIEKAKFCKVKTTLVKKL